MRANNEFVSGDWSDPYEIPISSAGIGCGIDDNTVWMGSGSSDINASMYTSTNSINLDDQYATDSTNSIQSTNGKKKDVLSWKLNMNESEITFVQKVS